MPPPRSGISPSALGWALVGQAFWLPLVGIDLHDRWQAHQRQITPPQVAASQTSTTRPRPFSLNDLLGATRPVQHLANQANAAVSGAVGQAVTGAGVLLSTAGSGVSSLLDRPFSASVESPAPPAAPGAGPAASGSLLALVSAGPPPATALSMAPTPSSLLSRGFTRAQLLGGGIGLGDLNEGPMAPLALVERALQASSGDPLAPLPTLWREPMRQALQKLPGQPQRLDMARMVFLPSSRVSRPTEVPLALQSDGSVDVLSAPSDPAVLGEIDGWSRLQRPPAAGSLVPAVVHLHPLSEPAPARPPATALARPAAPQTIQQAPSRSASPSLPPFLRTTRGSQPAAVPSTAPTESSRNQAAPVPETAPVPEAVPVPVAAPAIDQPAAAGIPADLPPPPPLPPLAEAAPGSQSSAPATSLGP